MHTSSPAFLALAPADAQILMGELGSGFLLLFSALFYTPSVRSSLPRNFNSTVCSFYIR